MIVDITEDNPNIRCREITSPDYLKYLLYTLTFFLIYTLFGTGLMFSLQQHSIITKKTSIYLFIAIYMIPITLVVFFILFASIFWCRLQASSFFQEYYVI